jgi:hypothetical protein
MVLLCLNRTLLMWLKVVPMEGKSTTEVWSSLCGGGGGGALIGGLRAWRICCPA